MVVTSVTIACPRGRLLIFNPVAATTTNQTNPSTNCPAHCLPTYLQQWRGAPVHGRASTGLCPVSIGRCLYLWSSGDLPTVPSSGVWGWTWLPPLHVFRKLLAKTWRALHMCHPPASSAVGWRPLVGCRSSDGVQFDLQPHMPLPPWGHHALLHWNRLDRTASLRRWGRKMPFLKFKSYNLVLIQTNHCSSSKFARHTWQQLEWWFFSIDLLQASQTSLQTPSSCPFNGQIWTMGASFHGIVQ